MKVRYRDLDNRGVTGSCRVLQVVGDNDAGDNVAEFAVTPAVKRAIDGAPAGYSVTGSAPYRHLMHGLTLVATENRPMALVDELVALEEGGGDAGASVVTDRAWYPVVPPGPTNNNLVEWNPTATFSSGRALLDFSDDATAPVFTIAGTYAVGVWAQLTGGDDPGKHIRLDVEIDSGSNDAIVIETGMSLDAPASGQLPTLYASGIWHADVGAMLFCAVNTDATDATAMTYRLFVQLLVEG